MINILGPDLTESDVFCGAHHAKTCEKCILNPSLARWLYFSWCNGECLWDYRLTKCYKPGNTFER